MGALCHALQRQNLDLVELLVMGGVDVNARRRGLVDSITWYGF
jgi:hypothetical protein